MKFNLSRSIVALLWPVVAAAPASAQAASDQIIVTGTRVSQSFKEKSTTSRLGLTVKETPASVEILEGEVIRARGDRSIVEAVTRGTGITSVATPGNGLTALAARGFSGHGSVALMLDGIRLYPGSGTLTFPFDTWTVERIEVLRGPASVLSGEGAIGGAINVVSKSPESRPKLAGLLALGSDALVQAAGGVGLNRGDWGARVDASFTNGNGWLDRGNGFRSFALSGAVSWQPAPNLRLTLQHDHGYNRPLAYFGTPLRDGKPDARLRRVNFNVADQIMQFDEDWTRLSLDWTPVADLTIRNIAYHLAVDREWRNAERYAFLSDGRVRRSDYLHIQHQQTQLGNRADATLRFPLLGQQSRILAGFDLNWIDFRHTNDSPYGGQSIIDPFAFDQGIYTSPQPFQPGFATRTDQVSLFAETQLRLAPTLAIVGGVRHDGYQLDRQDFRSPANGFRRSYASTSWRLGSVWDVTPTVALYGNYTTGADPLGSIITTAAAQRDFDLSDARQVEAGVKASLFAGRGEATLAVFDIVKKGLLTPDPDNRQVLQQVGQRSSRGVEASVSLQLSRTLALEANGTLLDASFDAFDEVVAGALVSRQGNTPPGVPRRAANAWATWAFLPGLSAQAGIRHVGERFTDNANLNRLPAYTIADAGLRWAVRPELTLDARVSNITDATYAQTNSGQNQWILGQPRRIDVRLIFGM